MSNYLLNTYIEYGGHKGMQIRGETPVRAYAKRRLSAYPYYQIYLFIFFFLFLRIINQTFGHFI